MKPPKESLIKIKKYCQKTQCRTCIYGSVYDNGDHYVSCDLLDKAPCDWLIEGEENESNSN